MSKMSVFICVALTMGTSAVQTAEWLVRIKKMVWTRPNPLAPCDELSLGLSTAARIVPQHHIQNQNKQTEPKQPKNRHRQPTATEQAQQRFIAVMSRPVDVHGQSVKRNTPRMHDDRRPNSRSSGRIHQPQPRR